MNFLAHLYLARSDDSLMMGGLLGDFVRGRLALMRYPKEIQAGIRLHRQIDKFTDTSDEVRMLRKQFSKPYRRYAGIIIDVAFDHELARRWSLYSDQSIDAFDRRVRVLLDAHDTLVPEKLRRFMAYADRRGLFATYRDEYEMLRSLTGIGKRLRRANPLHRTDEIWPQLKGRVGQCFEQFFPLLQAHVDHWLKRRSTMTGS